VSFTTAHELCKFKKSKYLTYEKEYDVKQLQEKVINL